MLLILLLAAISRSSALPLPTSSPESVSSSVFAAGSGDRLLLNGNSGIDVDRTRFYATTLFLPSAFA